MKQTIQYECPKCKVKYQISKGVECVNPFGWQPPKYDKFRVRKRCRPVDSDEQI